MSMLVNPFFVAASVVTDPHFSNVTGLWHFESTNGDTGPFVNSATASGHGGSLTRAGTGPSISTSQFQFGASSLRCITIGSSDNTANAYNFGTGDFTVEWWSRLDAISGANKVLVAFGNGSGADHTPIVYVDSSGIIRYYADGSAKITSASSTIAATTWYAISVCRVSGSNRMFVNGTQVGSTYTDSTNISQSAGVWVGTDKDNGAPVTGYIDELRITKGFGRYSANYTPDVTAFPDS